MVELGCKFDVENGSAGKAWESRTLMINKLIDKLLVRIPGY
jgi:hypothetical protein